MPASSWKSANYNLNLASPYKPPLSSSPLQHTTSNNTPQHFNHWLTAAIKALIFEHKQKPINKQIIIFSRDAASAGNLVVEL